MRAGGGRTGRGGGADRARGRRSARKREGPFAGARRVGTAAFAFLALATVGAGAARAQLPDASATTLGTAENTTATARGFAAISVNPAGLGMEGSGLSLAVVPVRVGTALSPVTLGDIADYEGVRIPRPTKESWLADVLDEGGESGAVDAQVSGLAITLGNFGFQVSSVGSVNVNLPPGVVEALLFGNAGRTGEPVAVSLENGEVRGFAASTAALSWAQPIEVMGWGAAVGATLKYTVGHGVVVGRSVRGSIENDPVSIAAEFPTVVTSEDARGDVDQGRGLGLDLGFTMQMNDLHLGATIQNAFNTFQWDVDKLAFVPGTADLQQGSNDYDFDERPFSEASSEARRLVRDMDLDPAVHLGAALDVTPELTVSGDLRRRFGDGGMALGPDFHLGGSVESRHLSVLHARAGLAVITDGFQYGGGASLILGPVNLSGAVLARNADREDGLLGQVTLSFWNR